MFLLNQTFIQKILSCLEDINNMQIEFPRIGMCSPSSSQTARFQGNVCASFPVGICLFKVNNKKTRTRYEICSKLTIKTPERVFTVNFEYISYLALEFQLLTLSR